MDELMEILTALRKSFQDAYEGYLEKAATFSKPPVVGDQWPRDGEYVLPSSEAFLKEFTRRASARTVDLMLSNPSKTEPKEALIRGGQRMAQK